MAVWFLLVSCVMVTPSLSVNQGARALDAPSQGAQPAPLSLAAAIAEAKRQVPLLQSSKATVAQRQWQVQQERASFLPRLDLFMGYVPLYEFATEATGATYQEGVVALKSPLSELGGMLQMPAFDGMQNVYRLRAHKLRLRAAQDSHGWEDFVTERLVRYRYREVQAAVLIEEAAQEQVKSLKSHLEQVRSMRGQRAATDFDLLRVQVRLEDANTELLKAQDTIVLSRRNLAQAMGLLADDRPLVGALPEVDRGAAQTVAAIDSKAVPLRLDVRALGHLQRAQQALKDAAASFWVPKVDVVGHYNRYNNWDRSIHHPELYKNSYIVGIRVRMNVFDGLASRSAAKAAALEGTKIEQEQRQLVLRQSYATEEARRGYLYAHALFAARNLNIERARQNLQLAFAGYRYGSQNSTDVLDAESDLYNAQADAVRARLAIEENAMALELALGQELG
jgi:outer membrane protein TolC